MEVKITEHKPLFAYLSSEEARHFRRKYGKNCEVRHVCLILLFWYGIRKFKVTIVKQKAIYSISANILTPKISQNVVL